MFNYVLNLGLFIWMATNFVKLGGGLLEGKWWSLLFLGKTYILMLSISNYIVWRKLKSKHSEYYSIWKFENVLININLAFLLYISTRVKSGIFGQTAKSGQPPCLFHSSVIGIKNKLTKQTVKILMRRLLRRAVSSGFPLFANVCPNLPDFTLTLTCTRSTLNSL